MIVAEELEKLSQLHRSGILTDDEFQSLKQRLIERITSRPPATQPVSDTLQPSLGWMRPLGWLMLWLSVLAFTYTACQVWSTKSEYEAFSQGVHNPLFFVGFPFALYWLS